MTVSDIEGRLSRARTAVAAAIAALDAAERAAREYRQAAGLPAVGSDSPAPWLARLVQDADRRDQAAGRRDQAAERRRSAVTGGSAADADDRRQDALDQAWAGRDRDAAAADRDELLTALREAGRVSRPRRRAEPARWPVARPGSRSRG